MAHKGSEGEGDHSPNLPNEMREDDRKSHDGKHHASDRRAASHDRKRDPNTTTKPVRDAAPARCEEHTTRKLFGI